jgi:hypothetical protein
VAAHGHPDARGSVGPNRRRAFRAEQGAGLDARKTPRARKARRAATGVVRPAQGEATERRHRIGAMSGQPDAPQERDLVPTYVELAFESIASVIDAAEAELRVGAVEDRDRCCGYFPALAGMSGIRTQLPACRAFAEALPAIQHGGMTYAFNFLRLSLVRQSADPAFHLDSDAATALTGDLASLNERVVLRLLLNLSRREERRLHYLDVDPLTVKLVADGSYVRAKDPERLQTRARLAVIPPRVGTTVHGLAFASNRVLHSGLDGEHGHFVAAYGSERAAGGGGRRRSPNATRTRSRSAR